MAPQLFVKSDKVLILNWISELTARNPEGKPCAASYGDYLYQRICADSRGTDASGWKGTTLGVNSDAGRSDGIEAE